MNKRGNEGIMQTKEKIRIGVLFGGKSGEHEVSFCSAKSIIEAIDQNQYEVIPIGITREGHWLSPEESWVSLKTENIKGEDVIAWKSNPEKQQFLILNEKSPTNQFKLLQKIDVIFPVLHGPYGEDGTIQGLLELMGIPYVGSGVVSSAVGMDKEFMKRIFQQANLPQTRWITLRRHQWLQEGDKIIKEIERKLHYPLFVKPCNLGSSVGISKVEKREELSEAINLAASYDRKIIIEEGIENAIEIECSVLGNDNPRVSIVGEVKPGGQYYDYISKYLDQNTQLIIPARIPEHITKEIQCIAKNAYMVIDAAGMSRVDFFLQSENENYSVYLNEINTIPGFTKASMYPKLWEKSGIDFSELIHQLIEFALERFHDKKINRTDFPSGLLREEIK